MGQILSHPVTKKESEEHGDKSLHYALSCMQGWRTSMEDSHTTILNLNEDEATKDIVAFFGVFDGHGGEKVALFTGEKIGEIVKATESFQAASYAQSLIDGFLATDVEILKEPRLKNDQSGCAATSCLVTKDSIICGNAGDSRTVMSVSGVVKNLSFDHKPTHEGEKARICAAGGFVDVGRVNGNLALSRGIGDFDFKRNTDLPPEEQIVTCLPDIIEHKRTSEDEFIVLACDGIWDCLTSQQVVDFVRRGIKDDEPLVKICESMMDVCLAPNSNGSGIGCDNMSVCIVALLQNEESLKEWYARIAAKMVDDEPLPSADEMSLRIHNTTVESKYQNDQDSGSDHMDINDDSGPGQDMTQQIFAQLLAASTSNQNIRFINSSTSAILESIKQPDNYNDDEEDEDDDSGHAIEEIEDTKE